MSAPGFCAVCGRTFLVGERVRTYVSAEGRHEVCELCAERTEELGWLPADQDGAEERLRADASRKPGFLTKLFARPEREEAEDEYFDGLEAVIDDEPMPAPRPLASHDLDTERYDVEAEWTDDELAESDPVTERPEAHRPNALRRLADLLAPSAPKNATPADVPSPASKTPVDAPPAPPPSDASERESMDPRTNLEAVRERGGPSTPAPATPPNNERPDKEVGGTRPDPAGRGMRPRRLQPDLSPTTRFERAIVRFNAGEAGRTVAGLTRTLGAPSVSVGDLAGSEDVVRVTVAWELTWYQWGVDLGDELRPVYELAKGFEVEEIDAAARQWNASAHDGRIVMVAPGRRAAENGRPVHHR